ncbi:MAG: AI-2E family transporter [Bacteroidetes bacterium]|nr:AI-2E family transporter [Bacteroidota bacterium]
MLKRFQEHIPTYLKLSVIMLGLVALFFSIFMAQNILIPLVFSVLVSILLNPVVNLLINRRVNRIVAITLILLVAIILMAALLLFFGSQFEKFGDALPQLKEKAVKLYQDITEWTSRTFNLSGERLKFLVNKGKSEGMSSGKEVIGSTVNTLSHFFVLLLLIPVYIFLILLYKPLILTFISKLFPVGQHTTVIEILSESKSLIQQYLLGLLIELAIVSSLTAVGLFFIGVESPILFGIITGLLNMIPYVGVLVANMILVVFTLVTKSPSSAALVLGLLIVVQFIDNNILIPKVVGSKVKINALATIVTVLIGGELCGVAGMFLAIPVTAVFKVICDRVEPLEPLGYLLGDHMPSPLNKIFNVRWPLKKAVAKD